MIEQQVKGLLDIYSGQLIVDIEHMNRDKDIALSTNVDVENKEKKCFDALDAIENITSQLTQYNSFISSLLPDVSN